MLEICYCLMPSLLFELHDILFEKTKKSDIFWGTCRSDPRLAQA